MKIGNPQFLAFQPRRLSAADDTSSDKQQQLLLENPTFARSLDVAKVGHDVMGAWTSLADSCVGRFASGGVAVGAGIWGANKLLNGKTMLDRIEAVGTLAMAADKAIDASGGHRPGGSLAMGLVRAGSDLIVGAADTVRGLREDNKRRLTVGLCQIAIGVCVATSALVPSVATLSTAVMCAAVVGRQAAIGFHINLPDKA